MLVRLAAIVLALVLLPSGALGQEEIDPTGEARAHFETATSAFDVGDFPTAAAEFRAAYDITHHPDLLFNIYSALEREGQLEEAAEALDGYLRDSESVGPERRAQMTARLARLRERIAESRAAEAERAQALAETDAETARQAERDARRAASGGQPHIAGIITLITAGVFAANFGVFAALSSFENDNLSESCGTFCTSDEVATLNAFNIVADISWITASAAAIAGLVMIFTLTEDSGGDEATALIAPYVAPQGAGATVAGLF